eukprot:CAMPEP_0119416476 /NCGR_PEP_ID=MMETSP1335-20130426/13088_1 /TAXON_ID=259385 /ORGANISM="Chrysoculter rhomboideus, Strain RCC1486" /LENGTH=61 /DNA_ID=CAMNT_0007441601 /DNA_START=221 /DNA_END=402 /DNA_ORIENTATION=+
MAIVTITVMPTVSPTTASRRAASGVVSTSLVEDGTWKTTMMSVIDVSRDAPTHKQAHVAPA